jgi:Ca-activated chloride channel homolog
MVTWESPLWFLALFGAPVLLAFFVWSELRRGRLTRVFASEVLLQETQKGITRARRYARVIFYVLAYIFVVLSLAGPQWGYHWQEIHRKGIDLIVGLDLSNSMLAEDVKPNRLERAKREIGDLLDVLPTDRIGVAAFAGSSFVVCPLTLDHAVVRMFLDDLRVGQIEPGGTDVGAMIARALKSFQSSEPGHKAILLISDGEDLEGRGMEAAMQARGKDVRIFCVGIGSETGAPIPIETAEGQKGFLKDREGKTVVSRLGDDSLQKIALSTGGAYLRIQGGAFQLASFYRDQISKMEKKELGETRKKVYEQRYQWPLSAALLFLVLGFIMEDKWKAPRSSLLRGLLKRRRGNALET